MKFTVNNKKLLKAVNMLSKAVAVRTSIDVLRGIFFKTEGENLVLISSNLEVGMQTSIECETEVDGQLVIESKMLLDIVRKLPYEDVTFETGENNLISIRCQNINFSIKYMPCEEFPMPDYIDENLYVELDGLKFKQLIESTGYAISAMDEKPEYSSHFIRMNGKNALMFSIDGFRIALCEREISNINFEDKKFIVKGRTMLDIASFIEPENKKIKFAYDDRHISVLIDKTIITTSLVVSRFLDYKSLIPTQFNSFVNVDLKNFTAAIERVSLVSSNKLIILETDSDMLKVSSYDESVGQGIEVIEANISGENFRIGFNGNYMIDAVRHITGEKIVLKLIDEMSAAVITPENDPSYINLVLPVKII